MAISTIERASPARTGAFEVTGEARRGAARRVENVAVEVLALRELAWMASRRGRGRRTDDSEQDLQRSPRREIARMAGARLRHRQKDFAPDALLEIALRASASVSMAQR